MPIITATYGGSRVQQTDIDQQTKDGVVTILKTADQPSPSSVLIFWGRLRKARYSPIAILISPLYVQDYMLKRKCGYQTIKSSNSIMEGKIIPHTDKAMRAAARAGGKALAESLLLKRAMPI